MPTLLIVDDHAGFRRSAARALAAQGWQVIGHASDGHSGLEAAARLQPDMVLVDVGLPDLSGLDVAAQLRKRHPGIAVVVTSTHDREDYAEVAAASGARGFLSKVELSGSALSALLAA